MLKLGAIGCGNMATAILKGVKAGMGEDCRLFGFDVQEEKMKALEGSIGMKPLSSAGKVLEEAEFVLLSVKPQNMDELLSELAASENKDRVYLSIAAGVTADRIKKALGFDAKVVPIMPNTPLLLGQGAVAMAKVSPVSQEEFDTARQIFQCAGVVREIPADKMNEIIAINGSTPAFLYEFAKGYIQYGAEQGIPYETFPDPNGVLQGGNYHRRACRPAGKRPAKGGCRFLPGLRQTGLRAGPRQITGLSA